MPVQDATVPACLVITDPLAAPVRTVLNTPRVAVRPTPDGGVALESRWAEESVVVGADGELSVPEDTVTGLLAEAAEMLSGSPRLTVRRVGLGPKPIPGDGEPVVGELVAAEVLTGRPSPVLQPFRIDRFS